MTLDSLIAEGITFVLPIVVAIHVGLGFYSFRFRKVPARQCLFGVAMFLQAIWGWCS